MHTRLFAVLVAALAAVMGGVPASGASPTFNPPKQFYLSLGDSVAFGYQDAKFKAEVLAGTYSPSDFPGYTYRFGAAMQQLRPGLNVVDYACPGETTTSHMGTCAFEATGFALHDGYSGESQMQAGLDFLRAHPRRSVSLPTALGQAGRTVQTWAEQPGSAGYDLSIHAGELAVAPISRSTLSHEGANPWSPAPLWRSAWS
jgi:hypothetical protein